MAVLFNTSAVTAPLSVTPTRTRTRQTLWRLCQRIGLAVISMLFIMLLIAGQSHAEQEMGSMPYKKINKMLVIIDKYAKSPYTALIASIKPESDNLKISDLMLTLHHNDQIIKHIDIAPDGSINFPLIEENIAKTASLKINQTKGSVAMGFTAGIKAIDTLEVDYRQVFTVLDDLETVASELVGIPSWMIPDIDEITFHFSQPSSIKLVGPKEEFLATTNEDKEITLERDSELEKAAYKIVFSHLPTSTTIIH